MRIEEVDEDLTEHPARITESRIVKVEYEHVCIDNSFDQGDHKLEPGENLRDVFESIVIVPGPILHDIPIWVILQT